MFRRKACRSTWRGLVPDDKAIEDSDDALKERFSIVK